MRKISRRAFIGAATAGSAAAYLAAACSDDGDKQGSVDTPASGASRASTSPTARAGADRGAAGLRWFGQSMFLLTSPAGATVLLDPFHDIGYTLPAPRVVDVSTITHEHPDHNNDTLAAAPSRILRGLTADGWADIDEPAGDVRIRTVRAFHDDSQGSMFGRNAIFIFETAGLTIAHLGDLGHKLDDAQRAAVGPVDVLMVPTGGSFSIGPAAATEVTAQIAPKMVFPMHYQTAKASSLKETAEPFLAGKTVRRVGSTEIRLARADLPDALTAYVLDYD